MSDQHREALLSRRQDEHHHWIQNQVSKGGVNSELSLWLVLGPSVETIVWGVILKSVAVPYYKTEVFVIAHMQ